MASISVASNAIVLELLDQHNYEDWSSRLEIYLLAEDLWDVVNTEPPKREVGEAEYKAWMAKNARALHAITISCGPQLFCFIRKTRTAKIAWEVLENEYGVKSEFIQYLEKKEREERNKSLHTEIKDAREQLMPADEVSGEEGNQNNSNCDFDPSYQPFFDSVKSGDWDTAKERLDAFPNAIRAKNPANNGYTALHVATWQEHVHVVKELVSLMTQEDLEIRDDYGRTALHIAGLVPNADVLKELVPRMRKEALEIKDGSGYTALARIISQEYSEEYMIELIKPMVVTNHKILGIVTGPVSYIPLIPVVQAYNWLKFQLGRYLYSVTPPEALAGSQGASLICYCLQAKEFDIPRHLLLLCPRLAMVETVHGDKSPLLELSRMHSAFLSDVRFKFWQRWIYDSISIQVPSISNIHDLSIAVSNSEDDGARGTHRDCIPLAGTPGSLFKRLAESILEVLGINRIYEMKLIQTQMFELIRCMTEATTNEDDLTLPQYNLIKKSIFEAIERGDIEFVKHVCKTNAELLHIYDTKGRSIFHFAIECRQEEIYCLIYGLEKKERNQFVLLIATFNNTILHGAGNLSPLSQSNYIQGASLQMQRELQWFKEVKSLVPLALHGVRNASEHLTASELFHKNHEKLMVEAEISMKGIASSCTVVNALMVTMMFAALFTVPGGNDGTTGLPIFIDENLFLGYIASVTTSLAASMTSVIIFLGILTSRYSEEDYLKILPTMMIIGLFTLFIAITTTMIAFSCGLHIMLHRRYSWIAIPSILVAGIPVASMMWKLFPLLIQTFISTYGHGIFNKKVNRWC